MSHHATRRPTAVEELATMPDLRDNPFVQGMAHTIDANPEIERLAELDRQVSGDSTAQRLAQNLAADLVHVVAEAVAHADAESLAWLDALAECVGVASMDAVVAEARRRARG